MVSQREAQWYAFVTRPRHEKKAKSYLEGVNISFYLPLRKTLNQWKDRRRWVESPLFPGYIFCHIPYINRYDVLRAPSIVRVIGFKNEPTPVRDMEIQAIKLLLSNDIEIEVRNGLVEGDFVRIASGLLMGYEGQIVKERGSHLFVIYIATIGKSVIVDAKTIKLDKI